MGLLMECSLILVQGNMRCDCETVQQCIFIYLVIQKVFLKCIFTYI